MSYQCLSNYNHSQPVLAACLFDICLNMWVNSLFRFGFNFSLSKLTQRKRSKTDLYSIKERNRTILGNDINLHKLNSKSDSVCKEAHLFHARQNCLESKTRSHFVTSSWHSYSLPHATCWIEKSEQACVLVYVCRQFGTVSSSRISLFIVSFF